MRVSLHVMPIVAVAFVSLMGLMACGADRTTAEPSNQSLVAAHVPPKEDFDAFLRRDLEAHFSSALGMPVTITYRLLRSAATQSGSAYPTFYALITIAEQGTMREDGAVSVNAIGKERFVVTYYVRRQDIVQNPDELTTHFPRSVADVIRLTYPQCAPPTFC